MSNKQFKVMVVPRWFTITPETVKALAYVYDYHVRDMPSFLKPNSLNINGALRAKSRLEGIVQAHSILNKTSWDYIQGCKKFTNPDPVGYFTGCVGVDTADGERDYRTTIDPSFQIPQLTLKKEYEFPVVSTLNGRIYIEGGSQPSRFERDIIRNKDNNPDDFDYILKNNVNS